MTPSGHLRVLVLIPAHNEAANLPAVVAEIRAEKVNGAPHVDILVVDDGSEDDTQTVLPALDTRWLRMPVQVGLGTAVRTGLRYARSHGYDIVVRLDGDGQHPAALIAPLIEPITSGQADAAMGSRYATRRRPADVPFSRRLLHYALGRVLTFLTGRLVTDPTSGLWAFDARAVDLLADHHPSGYPEPELLMFLSRNRLRVAEVPVTMRERMAGRTSLTLRRTGAAMARLTLHLVVVPLRATVKGRR